MFIFDHKTSIVINYTASSARKTGENYYIKIAIKKHSKSECKARAASLRCKMSSELFIFDRLSVYIVINIDYCLYRMYPSRLSKEQTESDDISTFIFHCCEQFENL